MNVLISKPRCNSPINSTSLVLSSNVFIKHKFFNIHSIYRAQDGKVCLQGVHNDCLGIYLEEVLYVCVPKLIDCAVQLRLILLKSLKSHNKLFPGQTHLTQLMCVYITFLKLKVFYLLQKKKKEIARKKAWNN